MKVEMAATDFADNTARRSSTATKTGNQGQEQEQLPCPRCDSINTKFCYYNNYNFSQPRHFCKSCRRYWTQGGTLRDIPIGGGTRKSAKRSRTTTSHVSPTMSTTSAVTSSVLGGHQVQDFTLQATPVLMPFNGSSSSSSSSSNGQFCGVGGDLKGISNGGFTSLLSTQAPGFFALSGFGLGLGSNFVGDVGLSGLGRAGVWGFTGIGGDSGGGGSNGGGGNGSGINNTWQLETGDANSTAFVNGDCFSWPDLAISTPGNGLK